MVQPGFSPPPAPMPGVREHASDLAELIAAAERAKRAWNRTQLRDALTSVRFFLDQVEAGLACSKSAPVIPEPRGESIS